MENGKESFQSGEYPIKYMSLHLTPMTILRPSRCDLGLLPPLEDLQSFKGTLLYYLLLVSC
jgi:hypothetical protein